MSLSKTSWDEIMRVTLHKMGENSPAGVSLNQEAVVLAMRDNWELLSNKKACVAYLAEKDLTAKRTARDAALAQSRALATEIAELEKKS